jgi:hypothetical protein
LKRKSTGRRASAAEFPMLEPVLVGSRMQSVYLVCVLIITSNLEMARN